jgi:hypothetical protein
MALGPCLEIDTGDFATLDLDAVARWVAERLWPESPKGG